MRKSIAKVVTGSLMLAIVAGSAGLRFHVPPPPVLVFYECGYPEGYLDGCIMDAPQNIHVPLYPHLNGLEYRFILVVSHETYAYDRTGGLVGKLNDGALATPVWR